MKQSVTTSGNGSTARATTRRSDSKGDRAFVGTRIPADLQPRLKSKAEQSNLTVSEYVERLIAANLTQEGQRIA
ncbi:hypothetical protein [Citricoccus alkalitolerans]|uniref:Uncharacterized protein n=1 Tax=Citricoccus alkalitolerans TaxID=246603 RepID=A0ABV8Y1L8_9MICC